MGNEWIEWGGGECPVPAGTLVDVRFRDGEKATGVPASINSVGRSRLTLHWGISGKRSDIVEYRLHEPPHAAASDKQVAGTRYKDMGVEPWDVVDTWPIEQRIGAYRHGALKYLMRMGSKDESAQEIAKAIHYMEKLLEVLKAGAP